LFLIGALRVVIIIGQGWLWGGLEMLLVGGVAAILGYTIGHVLTRWFCLPII